MSNNILELYKEFKERNIEHIAYRDKILEENSVLFKNFWKEKVLNDEHNLEETDLDVIWGLPDWEVNITRKYFEEARIKNDNKRLFNQAIFVHFTPTWKSLFISIKKDNDLKNIFTKIFESNNDRDLILLLNKLFDYNKKTNLIKGIFGKELLIFNTMLSINNPKYFLSLSRLSERYKIIKYLQSIDFSYKSFGEKVIYSNRIILDYFKNHNIFDTPPTISCFLNDEDIMDIWDPVNDNTVPNQKTVEPNSQNTPLKTYSEFLLEEEQELIKAQLLSSQKRQQLLENANPKPTVTTVQQTVFNRNEYVKAEVLERANGICERCEQPAPFLKDNSNEPYLEVHHKIPLSEGGDDTVANAIALCPNCHRWAHNGKLSYEKF